MPEHQCFMCSLTFPLPTSLPSHERDKVQSENTDSLMGPDWLAHSSPNVPFAQLVPPNCSTLVYLMESFTAFKTMWKPSCSCPTWGVLFPSSSGNCYLYVWPWFLLGEMKLRICGHYSYTCPFSVEHHRSCAYFPHLPKFPKTALQWRGISILFSSYSVS